MRVYVILLIALVLAGCEANSRVEDAATTQVLIDKEFNLLVVDPNTGELVTLSPCGEKCRVFEKESVLIGTRNVAFLVNEFPNPTCCYTSIVDGVVSELCWELPEGMKCPVLK